jgi:hypothetical protein
MTIHKVHLIKPVAQPRKGHVWRNCRLLFLTLAIGIQCTSEKILTLKSDLEAEVFFVETGDKPSQSLGKTPLRLVNPTLPLYVSFRRLGHESIDLIAFDESVLGGEIQVKIGPPHKDRTQQERQKLDTRSIDGIGRAHRFLLRGQVTDARRTLDHMEQLTGTGGYSALALRGHIELLEGHVENSLKYYQFLNSIQDQIFSTPQGSP